MWRIGIAFLIGQCCLHAVSSLPYLWPGALLLALGIGAAIFLRTYFLLAILLGFGWAWSHAQLRLDCDLPAELEGRDLIVTGRVASMLDVRNVDPQFEFDVEHASDERVSQRIRLAWYDSEARPRPGELWRFVVRLKRRNGFANPGGFDYEAHLFRTGITATGYVRQDALNRKLGDAGVRYPILRARAWIGDRIARATGNSPMLGILQGLAVGDTQAMTPEQWRVFAATGTSHLMAISGLHISMIATLAAYAGGCIVRWPGAQRLRLTAVHGQALAGGAAAIGYSLLAGMSVPTQRTLIMLGLFFGLRWLRRDIGIANALGIALLAVLIVDPFAPLTIGAWLSFGAVAIILLATSGRMKREGVLANFARVQAAVTIGLLPILALAFGSQSLVSPIANAVAVPVFTLLIVPLVLCGSALASLSLEAGGIVLGFAAQLLTWSWPTLSGLADQPWSMRYLPEMPVIYHLLLAIGALLLVVPSVWPTRFAAVLLCAPAFLYRPDPPPPGQYELAVLDVGQGLAIVVRTHSHTLVYDAGPAFRTGRDTGELVVVPYLRARGVRTLDRLMISHDDLDHRGGMQSILRSIATESVWVGPSVQNAPSGAQRCIAGQQWQWDLVTFEVLHPMDDAGASDNDTSCVLRITASGSASALLTGDIEAAAELDLVGRGLPATDVVIVAHHGSRSSSTDAFVAATHPRFAVVSAGYRNRWGFPQARITARWQDAGAKVMSTIDAGAIEIAMAPGRQIVVREHRRPRVRYWASR
jgi:competence protein ComEC